MKNRPSSPISKTLHSTSESKTVRLRIEIRGAVQGVGFRPFVYRLARDEKLKGWIRNSPGGVVIEAEGEEESLRRLMLRLHREKPTHSFYQSLEATFLDPIGLSEFSILESLDGEKRTVVLPDIATCPECLADLFDPSNRRYRYPFTNCTQCGPRYSIIRSLPYDRERTSMAAFAQCPECQVEYRDPLDRRFHAQPNACPVCGPQVSLWGEGGQTLADSEAALQLSVEAIRQGLIVAVKGLGGFHLMVDARNDDAVRRLRARKHREEKPFAVMFPGLAQVQRVCEVTDLEERLLVSSESPIVLLERKEEPPPAQDRISDAVAPGNPLLGVLLPYTPLHHLLLTDLGMPVVATSGNLSDDPICTQEDEALKSLAGIADRFLVHNRPILRPVDDSIVRVLAGREGILRRARGYAPLPISLEADLSPSLAVGALLKNTVAIGRDQEAILSQHLGDLETSPSYDSFQSTVTALQDLYDLAPGQVACDLHPDYLSTQFAEGLDRPLVRVQHHYAHVLSCMAENHLAPPVLGVSWDGTGLGDDRTLWGGEFLRVTATGHERCATFLPFPLPGADRAAREPRRSALGILWTLLGREGMRALNHPLLKAFSQEELHTLGLLLEKGLNSPLTSSVGRLFDAVSALLGHRARSSFEGQAAMELEFLARKSPSEDIYPFSMSEGDSRTPQGPWLIDWRPVVGAILEDVRIGKDVADIARRFHLGLVDAVVKVAHKAGIAKVVLTGGCFQNAILLERTIQELRRAGFQPYWHQRVPPNDGGIALGQLLALSRERKS